MQDNFDVYKYNINTRILNEQTIKLDDLTFDLLGPKPMFGWSFPKPSDESIKVFNQDDLERWKDETKDKYGNVVIQFDSNNKIEVLDNKFKQDKQQRIDGKGRDLKNMGTNV